MPLKKVSNNNYPNPQNSTTSDLRAILKNWQPKLVICKYLFHLGLILEQYVIEHKIISLKLHLILSIDFSNADFAKKLYG